jgi:hypothetical protein
MYKGSRVVTLGLRQILSNTEILTRFHGLVVFSIRRPLLSLRLDLTHYFIFFSSRVESDFNDVCTYICFMQRRCCNLVATLEREESVRITFSLSLRALTHCCVSCFHSAQLWKAEPVGNICLNSVTVD